MAIRLALVGAGRWGKRLLRVLDQLSDVALCCNESDLAVHAWMQHHYPHIRCTFEYEEVLRDPSIQAVVLATPIKTHALLARRALQAGKHVFVEKPLATTTAEAGDLVGIAAKRSLGVFVGHVFLYHPVMNKIRELTQTDTVVYARMSWAKFGTFEEDIYWNLLSHDVSLASSLFRGTVCEAEVVDERAFLTARDMVTVRLGFDDGRDCLIDVNRYARERVKRVNLFTAANQMYLWENDSLYSVAGRDEPELIYTKDIEPLALEVRAFIESIQTGEPAISDGAHGLEVVRILERLSGCPVGA